MSWTIDFIKNTVSENKITGLLLRLLGVKNKSIRRPSAGEWAWWSLLATERAEAKQDLSRGNPACLRIDLFLTTSLTKKFPARETVVRTISEVVHLSASPVHRDGSIWTKALEATSDMNPQHVF